MRAPAEAEVALGRLPNFLLIGAMKSGTTSLYHYLREHPQVFMPELKAPEFFAEGSNWHRGVDWYRRQFAGAGPEVAAIGEASNVYTKYPRYADVPARIAEHIPDAKMIYLVRDPVERIRSHYRTRVAEGTERAPFDTAVFENPIYLDYTRYAMQIDRYLDHFARTQLLIVTSEDLWNARAATVRSVFGFLGVDDAFLPPDLGREFYVSSDRFRRSLVPLRARKWLKAHVPAAKRAKELENDVLGALRGLRGSNGRRSAGPDEAPVSDGARARIHEALAGDLARLRVFLGPSFDGWGIA